MRKNYKHELYALLLIRYSYEVSYNAITHGDYVETKLNSSSTGWYVYLHDMMVKGTND